MGRKRHQYRQSDAVVPTTNLPGFDAIYPNGDALSSCWCERRLVRVTTADVRSGVTASCGHPACKPTAVSA